MALWDCSICSSSRGSSLTFPAPHKSCSRPGVPRGHRAVTHKSSEQDPLSPPSPVFSLWSSCLSFHLINPSPAFYFLFFFLASIPKLGRERRLGVDGRG